jgi:hypothetical protein
MIKATFYVPAVFNFLENRIFSSVTFTNGVKNYLFMFVDLRKQLAEHGIDLATQDINPPEESRLIIAFDEVTFFQTYERRVGQLIYLILNEPEHYWPDVWEKRNHLVFDRVFTYDYTLADGQKYIHHYFAADINDYPAFADVSKVEFNQRKLLVLVAGMFQLAPPRAGNNSLLYKRYLTMRWFGKHYPKQFDFYSRGLDPALYESFRGLGVLRRLLPTAVTNRLVAWVAAHRRQEVEAICRGPVPPLDKLKVLRQYKFVVCYENSSSPGYVSEKLFDCLFSGTVPVYLGEPNIERFVPADCFIDRRSFATEEELATFLMSMSYIQYHQYILAIRQFIATIDHNKFGSVANAERISKVLFADLADPAHISRPIAPSV